MGMAGIVDFTRFFREVGGISAARAGRKRERAGHVDVPTTAGTGPLVWRGIDMRFLWHFIRIGGRVPPLLEEILLQSPGFPAAEVVGGGHGFCSVGLDFEEFQGMGAAADDEAVAFDANLAGCEGGLDD